MDAMVPVAVQEDDSLAYWRVRILFWLIFSGLLIGIFAFIPVVFLVFKKQLWGMLFFEIIIWIVSITLLFSRSLSYRQRASAGMLILYGMGCMIIIHVGPLSGGPAWLFGFAVLTGILMGYKASIAALMMNAFTLTSLGWLISAGIFGQSFPFFHTTEAMVAAIANFMLLNALAAISVSVLVKGLMAVHEKEKHLIRTLTTEQAQLTRAKDELEKEIEERKQTENSLQESKKRYLTLFEAASDVILIIKNGIITECNFKALEMFECRHQQIIGQPLDNFFPPSQNDKMKISNSTGLNTSLQVFECKFLKHNGTLFDAEVGLTAIDLGSELHIQAIIRDITERRRTREIMVQTEKMMSVGGLAAGMAHEINNPLAGIIQNTQVVMNRFSPDLPANRDAAEKLGVSLEKIIAYLNHRQINELFDSIRKAGSRASQIVNNMLSFSRQGASNFNYFSLDELLEKAVELAENDYNLKNHYDFRNITIVREYDDTVPKVNCEGNMIQQVFLNILKNGAEAMADWGEKRKTLALGNEQWHSRLILRIKHRTEQARIEIEDNGPGIDEETRKRIFEPFFTTKDIGLGTGLGLSVSYFIIKEHHKGTMETKSEPGFYTKFIITLPLVSHSKTD